MGIVLVNFIEDLHHLILKGGRCHLESLAELLPLMPRGIELAGELIEDRPYLTTHDPCELLAVRMVGHQAVAIPREESNRSAEGIPAVERADDFGDLRGRELTYEEAGLWA